MKIKIIHHSSDTQEAEGLVVVIDVLRAFTTACFVINNGAKNIIPVADIELAYKIKEKNPDFVLIGERKGLKQPGFDFGNSPAEIEKLNFQDKTVIHTTTHGVQALSLVLKKNIKEVITGAFVNARAIIDYLLERQPDIVSLVCTDISGENNEDIMFAKYVESHLKGKPLDFQMIKKQLENHPHAYKFLVKPIHEFAQRDFHLCLDLNRFDFVLRAEKGEGDLIHLREIGGK